MLQVQTERSEVSRMKVGQHCEHARLLQRGFRASGPKQEKIAPEIAFGLAGKIGKDSFKIGK